MNEDFIFPMIAALLGMACMVYVSIFCRKMRAMGGGFPRRMAARALGEDASPEEVDEALGDLRRRVLLAGLALVALFLVLLAGSFLLAWSLSFSSRPLALTGLAFLALTLSLCAFMLADNMRPEEKG